MLRSLVLTIVLAAVASAQTATSWLDEVLLSKCDAIVVARVIKSNELTSGDLLVRFKVSETLLGPTRDEVLTIVSGAGLLSYRRLAKILFLERSRNGTVFGVVDFVDLVADDAEERVAFLKRLCELRGMTVRRSRERLRLGLVYDYLAARSGWVRRVLVREVDRMSRSSPPLIDGGGLIRLRKLAVGDLPARERRRFQEAVIRIEEANAVRWTREDLTFPDEASRESFYRDLAAFQRSRDAAARKAFLDDAVRVFGPRVAPLLVRALEDPMLEIREHAALHLGELESGAGSDRLLKIAVEPGPTALRRAAIVALGKIGVARAVDPLRKLVDTEALRDGALTALATINTGEAALFLKDYDDRLRLDPESPKELRWRVVYLRSDPFRKEVVEARRRRREARRGPIRNPVPEPVSRPAPPR